MPGMIDPPRYSPAAEMTSKVVAVPKSTTIVGPPYRNVRLLIVGSSCGFSPGVVGPDFATLTDAMQLTKSDYPSIDGAKFQSQSVSTADNDETGGSTSFCDNPLGPTKAGDQSAGTRITLANSRGVQKRVVSSSLMRTASPVDLQNWADRCLPGHQSGIDSSGFEVAGMPSGALVVEQEVRQRFCQLGLTDAGRPFDQQRLAAGGT